MTQRANAKSFYANRLILLPAKPAEFLQQCSPWSGHASEARGVRVRNLADDAARSSPCSHQALCSASLKG